MTNNYTLISRMLHVVRRANELELENASLHEAIVGLGTSALAAHADKVDAENFDLRAAVQEQIAMTGKLQRENAELLRKIQQQTDYANTLISDRTALRVTVATLNTKLAAIFAIFGDVK